MWVRCDFEELDGAAVAVVGDGGAHSKSEVWPQWSREGAAAATAGGFAGHGDVFEALQSEDEVLGCAGGHRVGQDPELPWPAGTVAGMGPPLPDSGKPARTVTERDGPDVRWHPEESVAQPRGQHEVATRIAPQIQLHHLRPARTPTQVVEHVLDPEAGVEGRQPDTHDVGGGVLHL